MINKNQIEEVLRNLSMCKDKKPYLSEAQFQFELAWELQNKAKEYEIDKILLEYTSYSIENKGKRKRFESDIIVKFNDNTYIAIELKYKTSEANVNGISLIQQAGQPGTKYDYLWDIRRIELLQQQKDENPYLTGTCIGGYAIFLTNDGSYWSERKGSAYKFRLTKGREIQAGEELDWEKDCADAKVKDWQVSRVPFSFSNSYCLEDWQQYISYPVDNKKEQKYFKYLLTAIGKCNN